MTQCKNAHLKGSDYCHAHKCQNAKEDVELHLTTNFMTKMKIYHGKNDGIKDETYKALKKDFCEDKNANLLPIPLMQEKSQLVPVDQENGDDLNTISHTPNEVTDKLRKRFELFKLQLDDRNVLDDDAIVERSSAAMRKYKLGVLDMVDESLSHLFHTMAGPKNSDGLQAKLDKLMEVESVVCGKDEEERLEKRHAENLAFLRECPPVAPADDAAAGADAAAAEPAAAEPAAAEPAAAEPAAADAAAVSMDVDDNA
jgi:hypothetical protein